MDTDTTPININEYNSFDGKLKASIRWLITRIYEEKDIPDNLLDLFFVDEKKTLRLLPIVIVCLQNGSLYTQAASKILQNNSLINASISSVLRALSSVGIVAREADGGYVTEDALSENPLKINTHLALIDALMVAHLKSVVSIEKVVQAISSYTAVDKREEPLDNVDALLFWINKICLLVRDDVERNDLVLESNGQAEATIPEMEDLYEDMCDGCAVSVLLAFYRPAEVSLQNIYFNDPMSINDCRYNLNLVKKFCESALPWNAFHFEVEDILYLHESLQPNVNVFLADLFYFFELQTKATAEPVVAPVQRRFVPVQGIPELRAQNIASRSPHPPKVNRFSHGSSQRDRTISAASVDSLMTTRSGDSLKYAPKQTNYIANATNFGEIQTSEQIRRKVQPAEDHHSQKSSAEVKLQMEDFRRQLERNKLIQSAMNEESRSKLSKDAFFKVMSKSTNDEEMSRLTSDAPPPAKIPYGSSREELLNQQVHCLQEQIDHLKLSQSPAQQLFGQPSHQDQIPVAHNPPYHPSQFGAHPYNMSSSALMDGHNLNNNRHILNVAAIPPYAKVNPATPARFMQQHQQSYDQANYALPQVEFNHQNYISGTSPYGGPGPVVDSSQSFQASTYQQQNFTVNHPGGVFHSANTPIFPMHSSTSQPNALNLIHQQTGQPPQFFEGQFIQQAYQQPTSNHYTAPYAQQQILSPEGAELQQQQHFYHLSQVESSNMMQLPDAYGNEIGNGTLPSAFRLHQPNASGSRLDPPLELNRNLTNWGLTYGERTPRKTWCKTQQNVSENEVEDRNGSITVQPSTHSPLATSNVEEAVHKQLPSVSKSSGPLPVASSAMSMPNNHQASPPTRETNSDPQLKPTRSLFAVEGEDETPEMTAEMQAKRRALLASQIKRKEKVVALTEEKEVEIAEKRQQEIEKQEQAEQRKLDREVKRQKLLEDYKRKKLEQELGDTSSGSSSARAVSTTSLNRGHSQPPFGRPKSQSNMGTINSRTLQRPSRNQSCLGEEENRTPRITVPSIAEPSLKLFAKHTPKSNRILIINALQHSIFPGVVSSDQKNKVQTAMSMSDSKHFLVLFRDHKCQYRGLYTWDQISDTAHRVDGTGPKLCREEHMTMMFKYDSGAKYFTQIPTKHLSATIDGFAIGDQYWQKPKIPHSSAR